LFAQVTLGQRSGVNVEERTPKGFTALHGAAMKGRAQAVRCLVHHGANPAAVDHAGRTALHLATLKDQVRGTGDVRGQPVKDSV
jgi:ankyrin repeat protein